MKGLILAGGGRYAVVSGFFAHFQDFIAYLRQTYDLLPAFNPYDGGDTGYFDYYNPRRYRKL